MALITGRDIEQRDLIGGRVVQRGHEHSVLGHLDTMLGQVCAHSQIIQQSRNQAGVDLSVVAAARTAIKPRIVGVVEGLPAMARKNDNAGERTAQRHRLENGRCGFSARGFGEN